MSDEELQKAIDSIANDSFEEANAIKSPQGDNKPTKIPHFDPPKEFMMPSSKNGAVDTPPRKVITPPKISPIPQRDPLPEFDDPEKPPVKDPNSVYIPTTEDGVEMKAAEELAALEKMRRSTENSDWGAFKDGALRELSILIGRAELPPEKKFKICVEIIKNGGDRTVLRTAYQAALNIPNTQKKAEALITIVDIIDDLNKK